MSAEESIGPVLDPRAQGGDAPPLMTAVSFILALVAGVLTLLGLVAAVIPGWGAVIAFLAPASALAGVIAGGVAMSRVRREARNRDLPTVAVILNVLAFFPAAMVAMTCGLCSAVVATGPIDVQRTFHVQMGYPVDPDGGMPFDLGEPPRAVPPDLDQLPPDEPVDGSSLPPPPLPAGPPGGDRGRP